MFTQNPGVIYAFTMYGDDFKTLPQTFAVPVAEPESVRRVRHIASGQQLSFKVVDGEIEVTMPEEIERSGVSDGFACER